MTIFLLIDPLNAKYSKKINKINAPTIFSMLTHTDPQKKFNLNIKYLGWHIYQKNKNTFNKIFSHLGAKNENHEYVAAQHVHKHIKSYSKMFPF